MVAQRRRKLASYEVAGDAFDKFICPERTVDFRRPFRTDFVLDMNQTLCVWLISGCPVGTNAVPKSFCDGRSQSNSRLQT
jgi:hypothetical protein